ncbi:hypothetical protein acdb102_23980 [Acidothermaceae bacterium B102]|nr:hypothetical protein acdb102_23980 [Acidothermaceae bacterium B102]
MPPPIDHGSTIVAIASSHVSTRAASRRHDNDAPELQSRPRPWYQRPGDAAASEPMYVGTSHSRVPQRPSPQERRSEASYLEHVIRTECAAWIALVQAVPDYATDGALAQLSSAQLELVADYLQAHAARVGALG